MSDEHKCSACPVEVRGLYASAANAFGAWSRHDDPSRVARKMQELSEALDLIKPIVEAHFDGLNLMTGQRTQGSPVSAEDRSKYGVIR